MGVVKTPKPVNLICAITYKDEDIRLKAEELLEEAYGEIDLRSKIYRFSNYTNYYEKEMGSPLYKYIVSFEKLIILEDPEIIKLKSNEIELVLSLDGKRRVNLDTGYLTESQLVLFSTKGYYHRIYLGKGIYAEVTLYYREGSFRPFDWTYRDYRDELVIGFLNRLRENYREKLKSWL
ncbi:MAG: DUF4416 family protein [Thermosulfidibacteraceae bacterium]|jgi:hypothetical protein